MTAFLPFFQVWDACSDARISFDPSRKFHDTCLDMGFIVENPVTIAAVRKQLKVLDSRVKVFYGAKLKKLNLPDLARDMVLLSLILACVKPLVAFLSVHLNRCSNAYAGASFFCWCHDERMNYIQHLQ